MRRAFFFLSLEIDRQDCSEENGAEEDEARKVEDDEGKKV